MQVCSVYMRVYTCVYQLQNDDGLWLRLTAESIREFCSPLNGYTEGWALQYNQHIAKTLLVPVTDRPAPTNDHPRLDRPHQPPAPPTHQPHLPEMVCLTDLLT